MITTMSPHAEQSSRQRLKSLVQQIVHDKKGVIRSRRLRLVMNYRSFFLHWIPLLI
uniref:Uncharacterized protein n=1 Tax=Parascaris univalens TaxID=6257 RepID=A0A915C640_PARUN